MGTTSMRHKDALRTKNTIRLCHIIFLIWRVNMKKKLNDLEFEKLQALYSVVSEICGEFSKMTDNYSLTTGDNKFENIPEEFREAINQRQRFVSYRLKLKNALINKVVSEMDEYE
jgi:hypothetical protein